MKDQEIRKQCLKDALITGDELKLALTDIIKDGERELDSLSIKEIVREAQLVVDRYEQAQEQIPGIKKFIDKYIFSYV
ncbi:MAG: hypothetical protein HQL08_11865 [Nitrospirae bacterium]|nr:hypothetical protein [Nitrospirota bacterium]